MRTTLEDGLRKTTDLQKLALQYQAKPIYLDDFNYEIVLAKIDQMAKEVKEIHSFVPKYLRQTEAERNL